MGGVFGVCSKGECVRDLFFGTDYHSHLGTQWGGMAVYDGENFNRAIHNIMNSPFRMRLEPDIPDLKGYVGVGCISDGDRQPLVVHSRIGTFAIVTVGRINNKKQLAERLISEDNACFTELSGGSINDTELIASLICRRGSVAEGVIYAQGAIEGSMTMLVCADGGIYAARDRLGRTPLSIGAKGGGGDGRCVSFESFAYINLGYKPERELGPGEVAFISEGKVAQVSPPGGEMRICSFLWTYYGYPTSDYEGVNVEEMRYRCGRSLAVQDRENAVAADIDYVAGVPDSGTAHAIGYANKSGAPFARPLIKYTPTWPRSFTPQEQSVRDLIARMKLVPINSIIENKKLILIEDSIVRGTQMLGITDFLFACGAKELHVRTACPALMYSCKYLNFSRSKSDGELIARRTIARLEGGDDSKCLEDYADCTSKRHKAMVACIQKSMNFTTLAFHTLSGLCGAIGVEKCRLCTYCWDGKE